MATGLTRCGSAAGNTLRALALLLVYGVPGAILLMATMYYLVLLLFGVMLAYGRARGMTEGAVNQMATTGVWRALEAAETQPSDYGPDFLVEAVPLERLQARNCEMYVEWRLYRVRFLLLRDSAGEFRAQVGRRIEIERNPAAAAYVPALLAVFGGAWLWLANRFRRMIAPRESKEIIGVRDSKDRPECLS